VSRPRTPAVLVSLAHEDDVRASIIALKYRGLESEARWMGEHLADLLHSAGLAPGTVTWVPTTAARRSRRGFDHASCIASHAARVLGVRSVALLRRVDSVPQTGSGRAERLVPPVFRARPPRRGEGLVVVVDDVVTTGATLDSARRALVAAGRSNDAVICAAVAATR